MIEDNACAESAWLISRMRRRTARTSGQSLKGPGRGANSRVLDGERTENGCSAPHKYRTVREGASASLSRPSDVSVDAGGNEAFGGGVVDWMLPAPTPVPPSRIL